MEAAVVLVEGPSDAVVLEVLAHRLGLDSAEVTTVSMQGVTNASRYLREYADRPATRVAGLCDRGEVRFVARALASELDLNAVPTPLLDVLTFAASLSRGPGSP